MCIKDINPRGALNFCSGRYVRPEFPNLGPCDRLDCRESRVLWADFQQKQGLENEYFAKFSSFLTKIAAKFWLLELKITIFSENVWFWTKNVGFFFEMRVLLTELRLNWGACEWQEIHEKGSWGPHIPVPPFQVSAPPGDFIECLGPKIENSWIHHWILK